MGLIKKYGKDLIGKVFIYQAENGWCIGRILELQHHRGFVRRVTYKPLGQSEDYGEDHVVFADFFELGTLMDEKSKLIKSSCHFEKYLELFNGTD